MQVVKKQRLTSTLPEPAHIQQVVIYHQEGDIQEAMNNVPTECKFLLTLTGLLYVNC